MKKSVYWDADTLLKQLSENPYLRTSRTLDRENVATG